MAKLYPPIIEGTIPAFCGTSLEVPFFMNRAVGRTQVASMALKIKKVNGSLIGTLADVNQNSINYAKSTAIFSLPNDIKSKLTIGEYYKIQLAYISEADGEIGYFSTIGIVKYTAVPQVSIANLTLSDTNNHLYNYTGIYVQSNKGGDPTEKLASSRFYLYDENQQLIKDSGEILHSNEKDTILNEAHETFSFNDDLPMDKTYYIEYNITTTNKLNYTSPRYKIAQRRQIKTNLDAHLEVKNNFEAGCITVDLVSNRLGQIASGMFILSRCNVTAGHNKWEKLKDFTLQSEYPTRLLYTDYTGEQGATYVYSLQQYNENSVYSERVLSNYVICDFEDLFLFDGERQLRIRFNPKVSTYKNTLVEQKQDTIGSKHPFILRNGIVNYKEFAVSGLISYQMDDNIELFLPKKELGIDSNDFNFTTDNIRAERDFKNAVNDWLINGEAKLFRSPTEGNYIVRLMNVALQPQDSLGRMLHTFNCNAYEIAECNYDTLLSYGLLKSVDQQKYQTRWATIELAKIDHATGKVVYKSGQLNKGINYGQEVVRPAYSVKFTEMAPGTYFLVGPSKEEAQTIYIGVTGSYYLETDKPFTYVGVPDGVEWQGKMTYSYQTYTTSTFDLIQDIVISDVPCEQFIGKWYETYHNTNSRGGLGIYYCSDIIDALTNVKETILSIKYIKVHKRELKSLYISSDLEGQFFLNEAPLKTVNDESYREEPFDIRGKMNDFTLYKIYNRRTNRLDIPGEGVYLDKDYEQTSFTGQYYDPYMPLNNAGRETGSIWGGSNWRTIPFSVLDYNERNLYKLTINGETIDLTDADEFSITSPYDYKSIELGYGLILEIGYQKQVITYNFESQSGAVGQAKKDYDQEVQKFIRTAIQSPPKNGMYNAQLPVWRTWNNFIAQLDNVVMTYRKENELG